jgi:predicted ester cyclase
MPIPWPAGCSSAAPAEHVFYRFRDHKIAQVWSLIDTAAIAAQAATTDR